MPYRQPEPLTLVSQRLLGRVILVTGASSGIGAAAVRRFAAEGAIVAAGGGSIVVTSSVGGLVGGAANTVYATSKHGLTGLVRCAALDYARAGIRVNAIAPGPTRSEMFDRWMPTDEARAAMAGHFPLNYIADPDDMARAALFLLSDESRWTTGTVFPCEGGITAR